MSDEQPTQEELAEAAALAEALEQGAERRAPALNVSEAVPKDALEVAALLRLLQPGAALDQARAEAVLTDVLGASGPVVSVRKPQSRWLWGGIGVGSSIAVAALCLLMLRSQGELAPVASAPASLQPTAAESAAEQNVTPPVPAAQGPGDAPAAVVPKVEPLEPALADALARSDKRAARHSAEEARPQIAESAKQIMAAPATPAAYAPAAVLNPAAARLVAAQAQIVPGASASIAQLERAQAEYRGYLRLQPTAAALGGAHARADSELTRGQLAAAIEQLELALGVAVRDGALAAAQTDMAFRAGALALQQGDAARALRIVAPSLSRAAANDPSVVSLWRLRAQAQRVVGDMAAAAVSDERAQRTLEQLRAP